MNLTVEKIIDGVRYTLTNQGLRVGDKVFPIARGRCLENGGWILHELDFRNFMCGFTEQPHTIVDLNYSKQKPYQVRTDKGYSPIESYLKIIKKEISEIEGEYFKRNVWKQVDL